MTKLAVQLAVLLCSCMRIDVAHALTPLSMCIAPPPSPFPPPSLPSFPPPPPGSPRAYNIPDRYHPEEDGADPRVRQTVLQQHVEFFDYVSGLG